MALPSSGTISANMINDEVPGRSATANAPLSGTSSTPQTGSLVKIYATASPAVNQSAPHAYSEFYGRSFTTLTPFWSGSGQVDAKFLCSQALDTQRWHNGSATYPVAGNTVYNNASGATTTAAYKYSAGASSGGSILGSYVITGTSGVVSSAGPCFP